MNPTALEPWGLRVLVAWLSPLGHGVRAALRWGADHTGLPMVVVAALVIVLGWRVIKRSLRVAFEVAVAVGILLAATRLGWITW